MLNIIIFYLCGSLLIWGIYFSNVAVLIVGFSLLLFFLASEHFDTISAFLQRNSGIKGMGEFLLSLAATIALFYYFYAVQSLFNFASLAFIYSVTLLVSSFHTLLYHNQKRLLHYPGFWFLTGLCIVGSLWILGSNALDRYEAISTENARIREAVLDSSNDRHPPLLGPRIIQNDNILE